MSSRLRPGSGKSRRLRSGVGMPSWLRRCGTRPIAWLALLGLLASLASPPGLHAASASGDAALALAEICGASGLRPAAPGEMPAPPVLHADAGGCLCCPPADVRPVPSPERLLFTVRRDGGPGVLQPAPSWLLPRHASDGRPALPPRGPPARS